MTPDPSVHRREAFRHVFLTRFSVRFTADQPTPAEDWLEYRLGFFEQASVASMRSQTVKADRWLVFCDAEAPTWLRNDLHDLGDGLFDVVWLEEPWGHGPLRRAVAEVADREFLITTRFDSDDALGVNFVSLVQQQFEAQDSMYVNLMCGLQLDRSGQMYRYDYPLNPFISYIERLDGTPKTVFQDFRHGESGRLAQVRNVVAEWSWVQVIHGGNLMNDVRGPRVSPQRVRQIVAMDLDYDQESHGAQLFSQQVVSWAKLISLWTRHPRYAADYLRANLSRRRGTTTLQRVRP